jgi:Carboxypeptidase regulatory-like domain
MRSRIRFLIFVLCVALASTAAAQTTGTIGGTVTASADGTPISGASVLVFDAQRKFVKVGSTDASGAYSISGLVPGIYYVRVSAANYVAQLYTGIPCVAAVFHQPVSRPDRHGNRRHSRSDRDGQRGPGPWRRDHASP